MRLPSTFVPLLTMLLSLHATRVVAQSDKSAELGTEPADNAVAVPRILFSGRMEPRIGASYEPVHERLRLDIGGGHTLYEYRVDRSHVLAISAAFFTWTRLRGTASFKFPVEAVDYYFGLGATGTLGGDPMKWFRVRAAHVSAHLVDGDTSLVGGSRGVSTYSREFLDVLLGTESSSRSSALDASTCYRAYAGAEWLFHSIPDTLGAISPYVGVEGSIGFNWLIPMRLEIGYNGRLNLELNPLLEHRLRFGVRFGEETSAALRLEAGYRYGRSEYGQYFDRVEEYFWIGFGMDIMPGVY